MNKHDQKINCFLFGACTNDARSRRLISILKPDIIHRGIFEWIGTHFSDINWQGAFQSIARLQQNGSLVIGGISGRWWLPEYESGPATVSQEIKDACTIQDGSKYNWKQIDIRNQIAIEQLIYIAKKQIDAGVDGLELDEYGDQLENHDDPYIINSFTQISNILKAYAQEAYGRKIYISANAKFGGNDYPLLIGTNNYGSEPVDYYLRMLPYRLQKDVTDITSYDHYDGTLNFIPYLRRAHEAVWPKRFYYFVDFSGKEFYTAPHHKEEWPGFYRISSAYALASGGFPGYFRSYYNNLDCLEIGVFQHVANLTKFLRENSELWHDLSFINPDVSISETNIYSSVFVQTGRTILHLVNGNFNNVNQEMSSKTNFIININVSTAPTRVWMTTPDQPVNVRRTVLVHDYYNGTVTVTVPHLDIHNIIVIEQGVKYNPVYAPLEIKFPFPIPEEIYVSNKLKITAVATDGFDGIFNWYVNNIEGGNNIVGTIDSDGVYTAPDNVPVADTITITAVSRVDKDRYNSFKIKILLEPPLPWKADFSSDIPGNIPCGWYIIDGKGDWEVALDSDTKVLHNSNISDGNGDAELTETALYNAFITGGNQKWTDYSYSVDVKLNSKPVHYYANRTGSFVGIVFKYQDPGNYYTYTISPDNSVRLLKTINGIITQIGDATLSEFIPTNVYTSLQVQTYGKESGFYVNSKLIRVDSVDELDTGAVGLKASFVNAYYKNINVQPIVTVPRELG